MKASFQHFVVSRVVSRMENVASHGAPLRADSCGNRHGTRLSVFPIRLPNNSHSLTLMDVFE